MTLDEFWEHVHKSKRANPREHADTLIQRLSKLPPEEIVDFDHWWNLMKFEADLWEVWGAAYIIGGGCSDDGFSDFRSWLVLQGRETFQVVVANPDALANLKLPERPRCECYPGSRAWFAATGLARDDQGYEEFAAVRRARCPFGAYPPERDRGENWDFNDEAECRKRLPKLSKKYL